MLLSILIQGTTISWLGEKLGVLGRNQTLIDYETARTRIRLAHGALDEIEKVNQSDFYDESVLSALKAHYEAQLSKAFNALKNSQINKELRNQEDTTQLMRRLLQHERTQILELRHRGRLGAQAADKLLEDVDARLLSLETGEPIVTVESNASGIDATAEKLSKAGPDTT